MKILSYLLLLIICVAAVTGRQYFPSEERGNDNRRFVQIPDDNGNLHLIDLKAELKIENPVYVTDVTFYLQTRANPGDDDGFMLPAADFNGSINSPLFDPTKMNVFTIHGWGGDHLSTNNRLTRDGILANEDANIFMVDYSRPAAQFYTLVRPLTNQIGAFIAEFIDKLMATYNIPSTKIMLSGQSLGGQLVGSVGSQMKERPFIGVALDPAGPLFYIDEPWDCIDPSDAVHVHVIHSNGGMAGLRSSVGEADFFPNGGGVSQVGCGVDLGGGCAHGRAQLYYGESLVTGGFRSVLCSNYNDFTAGLCDGNQEIFMGQYPIDLNAKGDYFLNTAGESPFALG